MLTGAAFFSIAGFFHEYYLSILAPPLAALVGIGLVELWRLRERHLGLAVILLLLAAGATLAMQLFTAASFVEKAGWLALAPALFAAGAVALIAAAARRRHLIQAAAIGCVMAALLVTPGIWAGLTALNSSANQSLPSAYGGSPSGPANNGGLQINQALLNYLEANTQGAKYLMAVPSAMQGADYVIATGRPVLYLGGFMGQDNVETTDSLARMVSDGELRFIYWDGRSRGGLGGNSGISSWVTSACKLVQGYETATRNQGAPDGTNAAGSGSRSFSQGDLQVTLYDCSGAQ